MSKYTFKEYEDRKILVGLMNQANEMTNGRGTELLMDLINEGPFTNPQATNANNPNWWQSWGGVGNQVYKHNQQLDTKHADLKQSADRMLASVGGDINRLSPEDKELVQQMQGFDPSKQYKNFDREKGLQIANKYGMRPQAATAASPASSATPGAAPTPPPGAPKPQSPSAQPTPWAQPIQALQQQMQARDKNIESLTAAFEKLQGIISQMAKSQQGSGSVPTPSSPSAPTNTPSPAPAPSPTNGAAPPAPTPPAPKPRNRKPKPVPVPEPEAAPVAPTRKPRVKKK